ncbi:MAG: two-partner secretion domain-containing protein [Gammaproteobacteria bacterium]
MKAVSRYLAFALSGLSAVGVAGAGPLEGTVRSGNATIAAGAGTTTVTQTSDRAVIDWRSFDIGAAESVVFNQPGAQSAALNRVTGSQFSSLQGTLSANGQVYLVNPNGILIGSGARIDAAAFVASTANVSTESFMASPSAANGRYVFNELTAAAGTSTIVNEGTITVADGGLVALVAPAVRNSGTITARLGTIELASARYFTLDLFGDDLVRIAADDSIAAALTDVQGNAVAAQLAVGGELRADGGRLVLLAVPAAANVVDNAINLTGIARARTVASGDRGEIRLLANDGAITVAGALDASAPDADTIGGRITAIGESVRVAGSGSADASGVGGGGMIELGGTYTAGDPTNTRQTLIDAGATIRACGTIACSTEGLGGDGNGGEIRVYSTDLTRVAGELDVTSGAAQRAGVIEVLSNEGPTELAPTARILARTGVGQLAGFAVVIGDTLDVSAGAEFQMRDVFAGLYPDVEPRVIAARNPADCAAGRCYVVDDSLDDVRTTRSSSHPLVFHAYAEDGNSGYDALLPPVFRDDPTQTSRIFASGREPPVGTVRPNGGAPSNLASGSADALAPIPITLAPPAAPPPATPPGSPSPPAGNDGGSADVPDVTSRVVRETVLQRDQDDESPRDGSDSTAALLAGGPGVARTADLGQFGGVNGASLDVFGVNYHVLAPSGDGDAAVADYLCKTPYATNGCRSDAAPE